MLALNEKPKIFISIISHGHMPLIHKLGVAASLAKNFDTIIKINVDSEVSNIDNVKVINGCYNKGFGENNNIVFNYCKNELGMRDEDYFIVLNPDIIIEANDIRNLVDTMSSKSSLVGAINLFRDIERKQLDKSIRKFPNILDFVKSFIGTKCLSYDKLQIKEEKKIDWAAGSFLAFRASHYAELRGFDESYFMYCEDLDICYRTYMLGYPVVYYPQIKATHLASFKNRNIISKHFIWHVLGAFRFAIRKSFNNKTNKCSKVNYE